MDNFGRLRFCKRKDNELAYRATVAIVRTIVVMPVTNIMETNMPTDMDVLCCRR
jgi:hypothetical protein